MSNLLDMHKSDIWWLNKRSVKIAFFVPYPLDGWNEYFNSCQRVSRANIDGIEMGPRESDDDLKRILYFLQYAFINQTS